MVFNTGTYMLAGHLGKLESSDERNTVARLSLEGPVGHQPLDEQVLLQQLSSSPPVKTLRKVP